MLSAALAPKSHLLIYSKACCPHRAPSLVGDRPSSSREPWKAFSRAVAWPAVTRVRGLSSCPATDGLPTCQLHPGRPRRTAVLGSCCRRETLGGSTWSWGTLLGFPQAETCFFICPVQAWPFTSCSMGASPVQWHLWFCCSLSWPLPPSLILMSGHTSGTQGPKTAHSGQPPTPVSMPCPRAAAGGGERL